MCYDNFFSVSEATAVQFFLYAVIISIMWIVVIDVIDRGCYVMADAVIELISYFSLTESWQIT